MLGEYMQRSSLISFSALSLVLMDRYQVYFLFWRLSLSPLLAISLTPLVSSPYRELDGVTSSSFSSLSFPPPKLAQKEPTVLNWEGKCWIWSGPFPIPLGLWLYVPMALYSSFQNHQFSVIAQI